MSDWQWAITPSRIELTHAIERLNCGFLVESRQGMIVYVNHRVLEWSGYRVSDLEGRPVEALTPPELHSLHEQERARVHEGDQRTRLSAFRRADGGIGRKGTTW